MDCVAGGAWWWGETVVALEGSPLLLVFAMAAAAVGDEELSAGEMGGAVSGGPGRVVRYRTSPTWFSKNSMPSDGLCCLLLRLYHSSLASQASWASGLLSSRLDLSVAVTVAGESALQWGSAMGRDWDKETISRCSL